MKTKVLSVIILLLVLNYASKIRAEELNDDLMDFDFESENESDRNTSEPSAFVDYERESSSKSIESELDDFGDEFGDEISKGDAGLENGIRKNPFSNKEKLIRTALIKAFTNKALRQKFVEVVPILRVISKPQKLAFAALISTQLNAKPGKELKLSQVESMFGDSRKLVVPLIFDIVNLVKNAAKSVLQPSYDYNYEDLPDPVNQINRRNYEITSAEDEDYEFDDGVLDAKLINEQLYATDNLRNNTRRSKRSAPLSFFDRLSFLMPQFAQRRTEYVDENQFQNRRLNTTSPIGLDNQKLTSDNFSNPPHNNAANSQQLSYEEVEDLAFVDLNGTDLRTNVNESSNDSIPEELPRPESLIGSRRRNVGNKLGHGYRKSPPYRHSVRPYKTLPTFGKCEKFTSSMCIRTEDYPVDQIMGSIRRHKHAMSALLAEYRDNSGELEQQEFLDDLLLNKKRREDDGGSTSGGMCASVVRYARPQKARSASGEWKYIVNTGQHTQTLRLEKCSHPQESCSYLTENYRSRCIQVYNYHRLLSWDKTRGLHVDIFKVPTCCSCHVDGYRETFPPLTTSFSNKLKDYSQQQHVVKPNAYSTLTDDDDYDEDDENGAESIAYQYSNGFKRVKSNKYDALFSSSNVKSNYDHSKGGTKSAGRTPTLGSYLSPPSDEFDPNYPFKRGPDLTANAGNGFLNGQSTRSRPRPINKNNYSPVVSGDRLDQDISGSDLVQEVTLYPTIERSTVRPKRKRISSVSTAQQPPSTGPIVDTSEPSATAAPHDASLFTKSILNTKLSNSKTDVNKRINYNYHPIIDFFEEQSLISSAASLPSSTMTPSPKMPRRFANINDRRIGGVSTIADNSWRPLIIE